MMAAADIAELGRCEVREWTRMAYRPVPGTPIVVCVGPRPDRVVGTTWAEGCRESRARQVDRDARRDLDAAQTAEVGHGGG